MALSKDQILNASDRKTETVNVPEWGGDVLVRGMTGQERDEYQSSLTKRIPNPKTGGYETVPDSKNANARFAVKVIVDEHGNQIFTDQDAVSVGGKSAAALQKVFEVGARLSGMTDEATEEAGKDSQPTPSGLVNADSGSGSHATSEQP